MARRPRPLRGAGAARRRPAGRAALLAPGPYSGLHAAAARAVVWYGPVDHFLGLLALTAGDPARAEGHLVAGLQEGGGDRRRAPGGVEPRAARPGPRGDGRVRA